MTRGRGRRTRAIGRQARRAAPLLAALALAGGCGPEPLPPAERVVLVTIDTLRADRLGSYGDPSAHTPVLDAVAATGVRFDAAFSPAPLTLPSHSSIFTGLDPPGHGVRSNSVYTLSPEVPVITERMKAAGLATAAFVAAYVLDARFGLDRGFDHYDDDVGERSAASFLSFAERPADSVVDAALAWLDEAPERFFLWVHLYDPHADYAPPPRYAALAPGDPYAGEIAFADAQVGRLLAGLHRRFGREGLALLVTSDHGESLGEHGESTHGLTVHDATQRVPLLLHAAGLPSGGVVRAPVRLVDVAPTLLELAGAEPLANVRGKSLLGLARGRPEPPRLAYAEAIEPQLTFRWSPLLSVRSATHRYIRAPRPELFDLEADPQALHDLHAEAPERAAELDAALEAMLAESRARAPADPAAAEALDPAERARLESLGYVVPEPDAVAALVVGEVGGPDPKDHMAEASAVQRARQLVADGFGERALAVLTGVRLEGDAVRRVRAEAALLAGRFDVLLDVGRAMEAENAEQAEPHYLIGMAHLGRGELDAAEARFERTVALAPDRAAGWLGLAQVAAARGDDEARSERLERADRLEERPGPARLELALLHLAAGRGEAGREALATLSPAFLERPEAQVRVARAEHAGGDTAAALARLAAACEADPGSRTLWSSRAALLAEAGRPDEAVVAYRRLLALDPTSPGAKNDLAWGLAVAGEGLDEALRLAQEALASLGPEPSLLDTLATVRLARGEAREALDAAERGLATAPEALRPHLHYVRAAALAELGRPAEARRALAALAAEPVPLAAPWDARAAALGRRLGG